MVEEECCILCFEPFVNRICYLRCGHSFHLFCFAQWRKKFLIEKWDQTCPLCRKFPHIILIKYLPPPLPIKSPPFSVQRLNDDNDNNENDLISSRSKKLFNFKVCKKFSDFISNFIRTRMMR